MRFPAALKYAPLLAGQLISKEWLHWLQTLGDAQPSIILTTRLDRAKHPPSKVLPGSILIEQDRGITYMAQMWQGQMQWVYSTGILRGLLTDMPGDLEDYERGFRYQATDYKRVFRWQSKADGWTYDDGQKEAREIIWYPGAVPAGYALCDGSDVDVTNSAAVVGSFTTPDLTGQYVKGGTYTGSVVAAANSLVLTGETADESGHTHTVSVPSVFTSGPTSGAVVQSGGGGGVASDSHTHQVPAQVVGTSGGSAHKHGIGTLAVTGSAEPAHLLLLPVVKL